MQSVSVTTDMSNAAHIGCPDRCRITVGFAAVPVLSYEMKHSVEGNLSFAVITFSEKYLYRTYVRVHIICRGTSYFSHDKSGKNSHLTVV